jgi:hypothetical protein
VFLDAKQLAVESLVQSPRGPSAERAKAIIHQVNQKLGIPEESAKPEPAKPVDDIDTSPIRDPIRPPPPPPVVAPEDRPSSGRLAATVHGALYAGLLGTTVGAFVDDSPETGAIPVGLVAAIAGGLTLPRLVDRLHWSERKVRIVGAATTWGGVAGGLLGDVAKLDGTTGREVLVAATVGATAAGLGGVLLARNSELTRGDVALVDTFAGIGAAGGFTIGMAMQPPEGEAYSLNSVLGITAGVVVGLIAAPQTNTTPRRMARVAAAAAVGGAAPFLLYAAINDSSSTTDEQVTGLLSSAGLVVGAYLGFRWTRGMDEGRDVLDDNGSRARTVDDAPVALIGRSSVGRWELGGVGISPLSPVLAPQHGMALQLVGAAF